MASVTRLVQGGRRFLITTHRNPDGDALGSALALAAGLRQLGKRVKIYDADPVPDFLKFLPGSKKVTSTLNKKEIFDGTFVVDCSDLSRVGDVFFSHPGRGPVMMIDHHARGHHDADICILDTKAASSGVVVHRLLKRLGVSIDSALATLLYVTLVTDTGNFRYSNTTGEVFDLASQWVRAGASPDAVSRALYDHSPEARLKLLGTALETLELFERGAIGCLTVTGGMLKRTGADLDMADDFVNYPRSLASVEIAVLFRESGSGWRVSLRSKVRADVGSVASILGGGGHRKAAGCTLKGSLEAVKRRTLSVLRHELSKYPIYKLKTAC